MQSAASAAATTKKPRPSNLGSYLNKPRNRNEASSIQQHVPPSLQTSTTINVTNVAIVDEEDEDLEDINLGLMHQYHFDSLPEEDTVDDECVQVQSPTGSCDASTSFTPGR